MVAATEFLPVWSNMIIFIATTAHNPPEVE